MKWIISGVVVGAAIFGGMVVKSWTVPRDLGVEAGELKPLPFTPNAVSSQTGEAKHYVKPFPFKDSEADSVAALMEVLSSREDIEVMTQDTRYIHAVATTDLMKFKDDLEFLVDAEQKVIHFRSASRVGYSDGGMNRERYTQLYDAYEAISK